MQSLLKASYSESERKRARDEDNNDGSGTTDNVSDELDQYMVGSMLTTRLIHCPCSVKVRNCVGNSQLYVCGSLLFG